MLTLGSINTPSHTQNLCLLYIEKRGYCDDLLFVWVFCIEWRCRCKCPIPKCRATQFRFPPQKGGVSLCRVQVCMRVFPFSYSVLATSAFWLLNKEQLLVLLPKAVFNSHPPGRMSSAIEVSIPFCCCNRTQHPISGELSIYRNSPSRTCHMILRKTEKWTVLRSRTHLH